MADDDPASCLDLEPGERVLWTGRAAVGAPWPPLPVLLPVAAAIGAAALLSLWLASQGDGTFVTLTFLLLLACLALVTVVVSKLMGPCYLAIASLLVFGPGVVATWLTLWLGAWRRGGLEEALGAVEPGSVAFVLLFVGVPLWRIAEVVRERLGARYVITDRQVARVHVSARGPRRAWVHPNVGLRLRRTWRARGGFLVIGVAVLDGHELHLRDDDPEQVLADVRRARTPGPA